MIVKIKGGAVRRATYSGRHVLASRFPSLGRAARVVAVLGLAAGALTATPGVATSAEAATGDGTITVRVVQEVNANGLVDSTTMEPPLSGVSVTLTDADGHTQSATTDDDGVAVITPSADLTGGQYRVDVTNPKPGVYYPGFAANGQSGAAAPVTAADLANPDNDKLSSDTEFVDVADGDNAYVNTSFWYPPYYCQNNAAVCDAVQTWDAAPGGTSLPSDKTLVSAPYQLDAGAAELATKADTGNVYGIAYDREHKRIFSAAYAKRAASYGPGGPGAIYVTDLTSTTYPLAGTTSQFATVPDAGPDDHDMATNQDYGFFDKVGKQSLGDIDVTNDDRYLFGVNEYDRTVFVYDLNDDSYVRSYDIPNPCADKADWRPMGTGTGLDTNYVGGVCSGQTGQDMSELSAHVYQFDPATGAFGDQVLDQSLAYGRGLATVTAGCNGSVGGSDTTGRWFSWISDYPSGDNEQNPAGCDSAQVGYPTPMLADIVEDTNGDLIVSFRDRFTDQTGLHATEKNADGDYSVTSAAPITGGDLVRGCKLTDGDFVLDPNYDPATEALAPGSVCTDNNTARGPANGYEPTTFREYYTGDFRLGGTHQEASFGGIALSRVEPNVLSSAMDPANEAWTQGVAAVGRDGLTAAGTQGVAADTGVVNTRFGKGAGMADLEVLCDQAPIQIGNRVWLDTDRDGIQDAGEPPVAGATVNLYDSDGNLAGTTTTDANGEYYFDNTDVDGGLKQNAEYTVKMDNPDDYATGGPLDGYVPTVANAGSDDEHDSDGVVPAGDRFPQISLTTGGPGQDNPTYDFGFTSPVSIGDYVWIDANGDGVQDSGEPPVPGATVKLLDSDGNTVATTTTDANGYYAFTDLPPNTDYTVQFPTTVTVDGTKYILTKPTQGSNTAKDSNPDQQTGRAPVTTPPSGNNSGEPNQADDPTIDAGYVPLADGAPTTPSSSQSSSPNPSPSPSPRPSTSPSVAAHPTSGSGPAGPAGSGSSLASTGVAALGILTGAALLLGSGLLLLITGRRKRSHG